MCSLSDLLCCYQRRLSPGDAWLLHRSLSSLQQFSVAEAVMCCTSTGIKQLQFLSFVEFYCAPKNTCTYLLNHAGPVCLIITASVMTKGIMSGGALYCLYISCSLLQAVCDKQEAKKEYITMKLAPLISQIVLQYSQYATQ